jgi:DNA-binding transcriptional LysR family regulator
MDLNELLVFARVVQAGSFTAAARALGLPKSTVSRKVSELEKRLEARLLQRTTRKLSLTDVGRTYYAYCARIVEEVEEAERAVGQLQEVPRGLLRVTVPQNFSFLGRIFAGYLRRHAEVRLEVVTTDRLVDLVADGFDVAVRIGRLADSTLVTRPLGHAHSVVVGSPAYLKKHGRPRAPADLAGHECLRFVSPGDPGWRLESNGELADVPVAARLVANDWDSLREAAAAGLGLTLLPVFLCAPDLRARRLERVLPGWSSAEVPIQAVYPSTRQLSPKLSSFLDELQAAMSPPPWQPRAPRVS